MISRDALCELASLEAPDHSALTFYYQPQRPRDRSHRDEEILIRDLVRNALRDSARGRTSRPAASDLERITTLAETLDGNHSRGKAVFACAAQGFWREYDLPPRLGRTTLNVNRRFHLRPLAALLAEPRCHVALVDRRRARFFDVWVDEAHQVDAIADELPRPTRSDGFNGYLAGHVERHIDNFALRHYQNVAERLLRRYANGSGFDRLLIGCHPEMRGDLEQQLHPYLRSIVLGYCALDVGNGRGALGLRHVLTAIERAEVQTVLLSDRLEASAVECDACGHLDTRVVRDCAVCGRPMQEIDDIADALIGHALRNRAGVIPIAGDTEFEHAGGVAALLRVRADQNTAAKKAVS
jgi:hypothetical protein